MENAESSPDSAKQNNPSLRANPQDLRGNPPCEKNAESTTRMVASRCSQILRIATLAFARNDENLDSSLRKCYAQNDKII